MKKQDIETLHRLFEMKQQSVAMQYRRLLAEQNRLLQEAEKCLRESYATDTDDAEPLSAGDLTARNRFRKHLRHKSARLVAAAKTMDDLIDGLRKKTRLALNRESAANSLLTDAKTKVRAETNKKDESAREQITLMRF